MKKLKRIFHNCFKDLFSKNHGFYWHKILTSSCEDLQIRNCGFLTIFQNHWFSQNFIIWKTLWSKLMKKFFQGTTDQKSSWWLKIFFGINFISLKKSWIFFKNLRTFWLKIKNFCCSKILDISKIFFQGHLYQKKKFNK